MGGTTQNFTYDRQNKTVIFKNTNYVYKNPRKDGSTIYKCNVIGCSSNLRLNKNKTKILNGTYLHNHNTPRNSTCSNLSPTPKIKIKNVSSKTSITPVTLLRSPNDSDHTRPSVETFPQIPLSTKTSNDIVILNPTPAVPPRPVLTQDTISTVPVSDESSPPTKREIDTASSTREKVSHTLVPTDQSSPHTNTLLNEHQTQDALNVISEKFSLNQSSNHEISQTGLLIVQKTSIGNLTPTNYRVPHKSCDSNLNSPNNSKEDVTCQTEIDMTGWKNLIDGLVNKICEQEKTIEDMRNQIKTLESPLQDKSPHVEERGHSSSKLRPIIENVETACQPAISKEVTDIPIESRRVIPTEPRPMIPTRSRPVIPTEPKPVINYNIIGDSHCRGLKYHLRRYSHKIETMFKPGSGFVGIRDSSTMSMSNLTSEHRVVYICGTNDVPDRNWDDAFHSVDHILSKFDTKQLCFVLVPVRWDKPHLNQYVQQFNHKLREKLKSKNVTYLDPNFYLRPWHYARDGLHLNSNGKRLLCLKLKTQIERATEFCKHPVIESRETGTCDNARVVISHTLCNVPTSDSSFLPQSRLGSTPCIPNIGIDRNMGTSFAFDQSYMYDMGHMSLSNPSAQTPHVNISDMNQFPILPVLTPVVNLTFDSTFQTTPQRHKEI